MKTIVLFSANSQFKVELKVDLLNNTENFTIMDIVGREEAEVVSGINFQQLPSSLTEMKTFATDNNLKMDIIDFNAETTVEHVVTSVTALAITTSGSMADGVDGESYQEQIEVEGGNAPFTFEVTDGDLPSGLTLDTRSGYISGVPTTVETQVFEITVTDSFGQSATEAGISIEITA